MRAFDSTDLTEDPEVRVAALEVVEPLDTVDRYEAGQAVIG